MVTVASLALAGLISLTQLPLVQRLEEADTREIGPGLIAFSIVVLLGIATFFLLRSMMYHVGKVPPTFDDDLPEVPEDPSAREVS